MSDPSRWLDPSGGAPSNARDLLAHAPKVPVLSPEAKARMAARIAQSSAVGAAGGAIGAGWKGLFGAGVIGLAGVAFFFVSRNHTPVPHRVVSPPVIAAPTAPLPVAPVHEPASTPVIDSHAAANAAPVIERSAHASPHAPAAPTSNPVDELALLQRADALVDRDPGAALSLAREHATRFPRGQLVQERERIAIRALAHAGRATEARTRGNAFLRRYPDSIYASPIRDLLRTLP